MFALTPTIVCTRPCVSAPSNRLGTITIPGLCCGTLIDGRSHQPAPRLSGVFHASHFSVTPFYPTVQTEMSLQLRERGRGSRILFILVKHNTITGVQKTRSLSLPAGFSQISVTQPYALSMLSSYESFPVMTLYMQTRQG